MINDKMFRAMCVFPDAWVYGYLAKNFEGYWIYDGNHVPYLIDVNSLGMATGMKDVNGVEIYGSVMVNGVLTRGGDILKIEPHGAESEVVWNAKKAAWYERLACCKDNGDTLKLYKSAKISTITGNQFSKDSK